MRWVLPVLVAWGLAVWVDGAVVRKDSAPFVSVVPSEDCGCFIPPNYGLYSK